MFTEEKDQNATIPTYFDAAGCIGHQECGEMAVSRSSDMKPVTCDSSCLLTSVIVILSAEETKR
jgi:hypothetical protein